MCAHLRIHDMWVVGMVPAGGVRAAIAPVVVVHRRQRRVRQVGKHGLHDVVVVEQAAKARQLKQRLHRSPGLLRNALTEALTS